MSNNQEPSGPFHAGPGTAHEIGVMVAFMAAFVIITLVYLVMWKVGNKRGEAQEMQRRQMLAEKTNPRNTGVMDDKSGARHSVAPGY
ncbi:hypothetical protein ABVK25_007355 [Lepraria finkii]|uniref:Uncharacterized protein n=1 Tax=Lepraria finkii TaxID=1340010 RepID=A0ABR4B3L7_9LECA